LILFEKILSSKKVNFILYIIRVFVLLVMLISEIIFYALATKEFKKIEIDMDDNYKEILDLYNKRRFQLNYVLSIIFSSLAFALSLLLFIANLEISENEIKPINNSLINNDDNNVDSNNNNINNENNNHINDINDNLNNNNQQSSDRLKLNINRNQSNNNEINPPENLINNVEENNEQLNNLLNSQKTNDFKIINQDANINIEPFIKQSQHNISKEININISHNNINIPDNNIKIEENNDIDNIKEEKEDNKEEKEEIEDNKEEEEEQPEFNS
jgi:hypothetical protein